MRSERTTTPSALHRLADRLGISRTYVAADGEARVVGDETLRALCGAMGHTAANDDEIEHALAVLDRAGPRLGPVFVVIEGGAIETPWRASVDAGGSFDWRIVQESGVVRSGQGRLEVGSGRRGRRTGAAFLRLSIAGVPTGYHRLEVDSADCTAAATLIVVPLRAYTPPGWRAERRRDWSITAQLYSLRSDRNWGIGDFSDLGALARHAARLGASSIGLNPLHALFAADPHRISPYSPSSRAFLNAVYIDVEAVPEFGCSDAAKAVVAGADFQARLRAVRDSEFVDYAAVWSLKLQVLGVLHAEFAAQRRRTPQGERAVAFRAFKDAGGAALSSFARFEALQRHFVDRGAGAAWRGWPAPYRRVDSPEVAAFAAAHDEAIDFSIYLQWEADRQLAAQAAAMRDAGMSTGLYRDLAVGVDPNGAEAWSDRGLLVGDATVGAPPDIYNTLGQDWGLTPFSPEALQRAGYAPFIATIRANMRHAGAVRIDHVIGLTRLYWVPLGMGAASGAYVAYPFDDLMGIVALESQRQRCLVVGEDLGTVPAGFRETAERRGVLSYRVLMFEREGGDGAFLPPSDYPELAAAAVSTHDLPTLAGLWAGRDLEWRRELSLYRNDDAAAADQALRDDTRRALIRALDPRADPATTGATRAGRGGHAPTASIGALAEAAHRYLAMAPSRLVLVQIEDLAGELEQMNLPGTLDEHPNWRRKLGRSIESLFADPTVVRIASAIRRARAK